MLLSKAGRKWGLVAPFLVAVRERGMSVHMMGWEASDDWEDLYEERKS